MRHEDAASYQRVMTVRLQFWGGVVLRLAFAAAGIYILWRVRAVLTVVIVSLVVACAMKALVDPLCRHRLFFMKPHKQRILATSFVFVALIAAIILTGKLFLAPFQSEFHRLAHNWPMYERQLELNFARARDWYATLPEDVRSFLDQQQDNFSVPTPSSFLSDFGKNTVNIASHALEFFLVPVLAFYFTLDARKLRNQFLFLVPKRRLRQTIAILDESNAIMRAYIISQFWLAVIAGVVVSTALKLIGMEYYLILGVFAAITRAIPVIGPFIGGIPLVLLTFAYGAQTGNPYLWVGATLAFTLMHLIETKFVMPQLLGQALKLHAVVIIIALLIGGEFFGLMGMFLAAPVAALIRVLVKHYLIPPSGRSRPEKSTARASGTVKIPRLARAIRAANTLDCTPDDDVETRLFATGKCRNLKGLRTIHNLTKDTATLGNTGIYCTRHRSGNNRMASHFIKRPPEDCPGTLAMARTRRKSDRYYAARHGRRSHHLFL
jgi:predicted PurR-regulated permease PerM